MRKSANASQIRDNGVAGGDGIDEEDLETPYGDAWRVVLFRGVRDGKLGEVERVAREHPAAVHDNFTRHMHDWQLEWDCTKWLVCSWIKA